MSISIIIPLYNAEKYVSESINSVIQQEFTDWELIVVDDGSSDKSLEIGRAFENDKIKILSQENRGASAARNHGFRNSTGDFILFLDADDVIPSNYLKELLTSVDSTEEAVVLAQWGRFYDDDLRTFSLVHNRGNVYNLESWVKEYWYNTDPMTNPGRILIPRSIILRAGLWNENLSLNDDLEFFTRIFKHSGSILFTNKTSLFYRSGIKGLSAQKSEAAYRSLYTSTELSVSYVLESNTDKDIYKSCANLWQLFVYEVYPLSPELVRKAEANILALGGSDLDFPCGGRTKILLHFVNWKLLKKYKRIAGKINKLPG